MKRVIFILLVLCCLFLLTCRGVLYDADIMTAVMLSSKLHNETTIGPIRINLNHCIDLEDARLLYIPDKSNFNTGFFIIVEGDQLHFRYINSAGKASSDEIQLPLLGNSEREPNFLLETISGSVISLLYINYSVSGGVSDTHYNFISYDNATDDLYSFFNYGDGDNLGAKLSSEMSSMGFSADPFINGAYISPQDQLLHLLCSGTSSLAGGDYVYFDISYTVNSNSLVLPPVYTHPSSMFVYLPFISNLDFYFGYDFNNARSWVSYPNSSFFYGNYYWYNGITNFIAASSTLPIHKLLTTSEFLSFDDNTAQLSSLGSVKHNSFPFGKDLYFAYEIATAIPGEYNSIITQAILISTDECNSIKCSFRVYSCPTEDLGDL